MYLGKLENRITISQICAVYKDSMERVQRRAARWITSSYDQTASVTALLQQLQLEPLEEWRRVNRLAFLYKILSEQVAVPPVKLDIIMNNRPVRGSVTQQRLHIYHVVGQQNFRNLSHQEQFLNGTLFLMPSRQLLRYLHLEAS